MNETHFEAEKQIFEFLVDIVFLSKKSQFHSAGDLTRVSVVPRKVTVKTGDADN